VLKTAKDEGYSAFEAEKELMRRLMKLTVRAS
jgi:hypothetical protein